ncbi:sugar ABC transporter permease [bacterium]|nr:sugar ABC transporter permease [bacterium]
MYKYYKKYVPYLFILPAAILLFLFFFIPFFETVVLSFKDYSTDLYSPGFIGLENYKILLTSKEFYKVICNTLLYLIGAVPVLTIIPLVLAILINQKIRCLNLYKVLIYIPVIISIVVVAIAFKWLYATQGILNYIAEILGFSAIEWLTSPDVAIWSVIAVTIYKGIGYYMMIYLSALIGAPKELLEAADVDGANLLQKHLNVTIPYLMPTIALVVTVSSISALKVFAEIYVMTRGGPLDSTKTIVYYIYERAFENLDLSMASAASVILLIIVMIFSILNILVFERKKYQP